MCDSKVLLVLAILLPIERNNLSLVQGISGKIWLSRRYNKVYKTTSVAINALSSDEMETTASTDIEYMNLTCKIHSTKDENFPQFSTAQKGVDSSFLIAFNMIGIVTSLIVLRK